MDLGIHVMPIISRITATYATPVKKRKTQAENNLKRVPDQFFNNFVKPFKQMPEKSFTQRLVQKSGPN